MEIFILTEKDGKWKIAKDVFNNVANLEQFYRDLDDIYGDLWFDNIEDAEEQLKELQ